MTLERNENYYGEAPTITRADYTLFADPVAQALVAFENDELDQAQVAGADLERVQNDPDPRAADAGLPALRHRSSSSATPRTRRPTTCACGRRWRWRSSATPWPTASSRASSRRRRRSCRRISPATTRTRRWARTRSKAKQLLAEAGFPNGGGLPRAYADLQRRYRRPRSKSPRNTCKASGNRPSASTSRSTHWRTRRSTTGSTPGRTSRST